MAGRYTLAMIKPDAVSAGNTGRILAHIEGDGYRIRAIRMLKLGQPEAEAFYAVHRGRPFYPELVSFMSSAATVAMVLERENAVAAWRETPGTIRKLFAESKGRNAVHGSDSDENAWREIAFFFSEYELAGLGVPLAG
jgi:nucleoside-diphosphate kinase